MAFMINIKTMEQKNLTFANLEGIFSNWIASYGP